MYDPVIVKTSRYGRLNLWNLCFLIRLKKDPFIGQERPSRVSLNCLYALPTIKTEPTYISLGMKIEKLKDIEENLKSPKTQERGKGISKNFVLNLKAQNSMY